MTSERSWGVVPLIKKGDQWEVLLVQHNTALYWGFPKGHPEEGETPQQADTRELFEETNLEVVEFLSNIPLEQHYKFMWKGKLINKTVGYFPAIVRGDVSIQLEEIKSYQWVAADRALDVISFPTDKAVWQQSLSFL